MHTLTEHHIYAFLSIYSNIEKTKNIEISTASANNFKAKNNSVLMDQTSTVR